MSEAQDTATAPALGIIVQCASEGSTITFQTHVAQDTDKAALDALVDRVAAVATRQKAKSDLEAMRKNLKVNETQLTRMREDRLRIETTLAAPQDGRRGTQRNEADLKQKREQADVNEARMVAIITEAKEEIAATEALIAGH